MTPRQWAECCIYVRHFSTPMQRADLNAALIRQSCGQWKSVPRLDSLLVQYGPAKRKSKQEIYQKFLAWGADINRQRKAEPAPAPVADQTSNVCLTSAS